MKPLKRILSAFIFAAFALPALAQKVNAPRIIVAGINQGFVFADAYPGTTTNAEIQAAIADNLAPFTIVVPATASGSSGDWIGDSASGNIEIEDFRGGAVLYGAPVAGALASTLNLLPGGTTFPALTVTNTTNQLVIGTTTTDTLNFAAPASSETITFPDPGGNDSVAYLAATQTFTNKILTLAHTGSGGIVLGSTGGGVTLTTSGASQSGTLNVTGLPGTGTWFAGELATGTATGSTTLLAANTCGDSVTATVTGAATTMAVVATGQGALPNAGLVIQAAVTSANTVTVEYCNVTTAGITPSALTIQLRVIQ